MYLWGLWTNYSCSAKHLFCYLAKTLGFISFCPPLLNLLLLCHLVLPTQIVFWSYLFSPFREQVNVEYLGGHKEAELVVSPGTYCL